MKINKNQQSTTNNNQTTSNIEQLPKMNQNLFKRTIRTTSSKQTPAQSQVGQQSHATQQINNSKITSEQLQHLKDVRAMALPGSQNTLKDFAPPIAQPGNISHASVMKRRQSLSSQLVGGQSNNGGGPLEGQQLQNNQIQGGTHPVKKQKELSLPHTKEGSRLVEFGHPNQGATSQSTKANANSSNLRNSHDTPKPSSQQIANSNNFKNVSKALQYAAGQAVGKKERPQSSSQYNHTEQIQNGTGISKKDGISIPKTIQNSGNETPLINLKGKSRNGDGKKSLITTMHNSNNATMNNLNPLPNNQKKQINQTHQGNQQNDRLVPSTGGSDFKLPKSSPNPLKNFEKAKFASKTHGLITSYAANTHQGIQRNYNEDRVSIILNMTRPPNKSHLKEWPKCSYFAIYDGHGGSSCADYLKDNLHQIIVQQETFPTDPAQALTTGCLEAEHQFLLMADGQTKHDRSGSCAIILLCVDTECFVANVGDSRAIMSADSGKKLFLLSRDHRPNEDNEIARIQANGGSVYQSQQVQHVQLPGLGTMQQQLVLGPHRVLPGRLSVSRTFGDIEGKWSKYGGKEGVLIAQPEISQFTVQPDFHDFVILGCDGIFDRMSNQHVLDVAWDAFNEGKNNQDPNMTIHQVTGMMTDAIIKQSAIEKSFDNLTIVKICFKNLENNFNTRVITKDLQTSSQMDTTPQQFKIKEILKSSNSQLPQKPLSPTHATGKAAAAMVNANERRSNNQALGSISGGANSNNLEHKSSNSLNKRMLSLNNTSNNTQNSSTAVSNSQNHRQGGDSSKDDIFPQISSNSKLRVNSEETVNSPTNMSNELQKAGANMALGDKMNDDEHAEQAKSSAFFRINSRSRQNKRQIAQTSSNLNALNGVTNINSQLQHNTTQQLNSLNHGLGQGGQMHFNTEIRKKNNLGALVSPTSHASAKETQKHLNK